MDWFLSRATARKLGSGIVVAALAMGAGISPVGASSAPGPSGRTAVRHLARSQAATPLLPATLTAKANQLNDGSVVVSWRGYNGRDSFDVYRSTTAGTLGSKLNSRAVRANFYNDRSATIGTPYYYTVVAQVRSGGQLISRAAPQVASSVAKALPKAVSKVVEPRHSKTTHSSTTTKTTTKRALTAKPLLISGACQVQLPDMITTSEHNFGCPAGSQIELLRLVGGGTDCTTLGTPDCDVYIGDDSHNVTETIDPGTTVYVDNAVDNESVTGDPSDAVDFLVASGSTLNFSGSSIAPAAVKSINEEPGSATPAADGDWGVIEYGYNGTSINTPLTATTPSFGNVTDTNFAYGSAFWMRESTVNFTGDVLRNMISSSPTAAPGDYVVLWDFSADPATNGAGKNAISVNGVDLIGDSGTTSFEGFFFNEVSANDGNAPDVTYSNDTVSNTSYPFDAELGNDNSGGSVSGNLTLHMFGDSTPSVFDSSFAETYDENDANAGNGTLTLDVHDNHASGNLEAGGLQDSGSDYVLDAEVFSGTGDATLTGSVLSSHLGGADMGMFAEAQSDLSDVSNTGNASISGLTLMNDNITTAGSGDSAFDGQAFASGAGNALASPTFQGNIVDATSADAVDLFAESFFGAGSSTASPTFLGGYYHGAGNALYQDARVSTANSGTGSATADGMFSLGTRLVSDFASARASHVQSDLGPATDSPSFDGTQFQGDVGVDFALDQVTDGTATGDLTVTPTFTNSSIVGFIFGVLGESFENAGSGSTVVSPSFTSSSINATEADGVLLSVSDTWTDTSAGSIQSNSTFTNTSVNSLVGDGVVLDSSGSGKNSDLSPTVSGSTFRAVGDAFDLSNGADGSADSGTATTNPSVTSSTLVSSFVSPLFITASSYKSAVADPSITGSTLAGLEEPVFAGATGSAFDDTHAGNAEALPTLTGDNITGSGTEVEAFANQNSGTGAAGSAHAGGTVTGSVLGGILGYASLAEQANGQGALSDPSITNTSVPALEVGVASSAFGWSNTTSATPTLSTDATVSLVNSQVNAVGTGVALAANDSSDNEAANPSAASTGPVSTDAQLSGTPVKAGGDARAIDSEAETDFIAGAVNATANDSNGPLTSGTQNERVSAYSNWGHCLSNCGLINEVDSTATGPATTVGSITSDTPNLQVSDNGFDSDLWETVTADNAAASSTVTENNLTSSSAPPQVDTTADANNGSGTDSSSSTVNVTNYTNDGTKGQLGVFVDNNAMGTGGAANSGAFDNLTMKQFMNEAGLGWFTGSGSGDTGTVSITHSNFSGGSFLDGLDIESLNPDATGSAPVLYAQGNLIQNITEADGIFDLGFVPEIIGNEIFGVTTSTPGTSALDVEEAGVSNSATLTVQRHTQPLRPPIPETSNGTISGNFLHDSNGGIQIDGDVTLMPNVNNNDFAGTTLSGGPDGFAPGPFLTVLPTDSLLVVDATNNWWGTTDATQIAGLYFTGGATVNVAPYLTSPGMSSGFVLDGWGGVHPYGGAGAVALTAYWPGWDIARGITTSPDGLGGYVLDGWGGVHPFGNLTTPPALTAYWPGWDIARGIAQVPGSPTEGYVLDGWGGVHPFGGAPDVTISAYWPGWDIANGIVVNPPSHLNPCVSGYVLDGWGGIHPFADTSADDGCSADNMPAAPALTAYWPGWDIARGLGLDAYGEGYVVDGWGGVHPFGGSPAVSVTGYWPGWDIARSIVVTPIGTGFVLDGWGGVHPFGFAPPVVTSAYWPGWDIARGVS